jgi:protein-arginine kinase
MNDDYLKAQLLFKLYRRGIWGGRHTPIKNLFHLMNKASIKESKKALKELNNLGWVQVKISTGEEHISLNSHKNKEIKEFILRVLRIDPSLLE